LPNVYLNNLLTDLLGSGLGSVLVTRFPWVIGRHADCDLCVDSPPVSRYHCRLVLYGDEVWVQDLASRNGTKLNGEPVGPGRPLRDGDQLIVACVPLEVRIDEPGEIGRPASTQSLPDFPR
jgi:pSer/pThr/pTyr-binding forkhead associated (FHA) protein